MEKEIKIKFEGVDSWGRPVFKDVDSNLRFGSTWTIFSWRNSDAEIVNHFKTNPQELEYFGSKFDCEPHGGKIKGIKLKIIE